jgi:hypothetical protein
VPYDESRQLVTGHTRCSIMPGAINPRCRPVQLAGGETAGMDPHDHIVLAGVWVGHIRQGESVDAGVTVSTAMAYITAPSLSGFVDGCRQVELEEGLVHNAT